MEMTAGNSVVGVPLSPHGFDTEPSKCIQLTAIIAPEVCSNTQIKLLEDLKRRQN
jgi:hypothetical protein